MKYLLHTLLFALLLLTQYSYAQSDKETTKKFNRSLELISGQYVDSADIARLTTVAIKAMLKELDPHSKYMSKKSLQKSQEGLRGNFSGVGVTYQILRDTLMVLRVVPNGPSATAGLLAGDKIIRIDDSLVVGKQVSNTYFSKMLRGKKGSKVKVEVLRHADKERYTYTIERGAIPIESVNAYFMLDKEVGYIKIRNFSQTTLAEMHRAMLQLKLKGMKHLILDLRSNPGGLMIAAINMADEFLKEERSIVYTEGLHYPRKNYNTTTTGNFQNGRVVVLINQNSASASEIVSGALQDNDRALIMGRRSFGKGLVGRNFYLTDGSGMRLTTGRYYTPSGRCIQKSYAKGEESYHKDLAKRMSSGELFHPDSIHFPDSLKYQTVNGRTVYGGGGITPDVFIPLDTTIKRPEYYQKLLKKGALNLFSATYYDRNLEKLQSEYSDYDDFHKRFQWDDELGKALVIYAKEELKIAEDSAGFAASKEEISTHFKAILARNLYNGSCYYEEFSIRDKELTQALTTIHRKEAFKSRGIQHR